MCLSDSNPHLGRNVQNNVGNEYNTKEEDVPRATREEKAMRQEIILKFLSQLPVSEYRIVIITLFIVLHLIEDKDRIQNKKSLEVIKMLYSKDP